ncbi:MAG: AI-2E family transporter [Actinobacteria bacterium]|nr:AI-2E family transporter [Actinomycetota bacterium]MDA2982248.1 AI-2E family transporter [Actinomycetota bacterium]MDA2996503.1 AI-2E family transporter [Actinomycetota bacterium]
MAKLKPIMKRPSLTGKKRAVAPEDFGKIGEPLNHSHPFYFGFVAASGAIIAITLLRAFASASQVFVLIIISLFFAMGLNPAVLFIQRRGLSRAKAVAATVSLVIGFVGVFIWIAAPLIIDQVNALINNAPQLISDLKSNSTIDELNKNYGIVDTVQNRVEASIKDGKFVIGAFGGVLGVGKAFISGVFSILTILVLTLYFLAALPTLTKDAYRLVPASRRERVAKISDAIIFRVGAFVGGQITISFFASIFIFLLSFVLDLPYKSALALVVFVCGLIPLIGHFIGMTIVTLIALTVSPLIAAIALASYIIYVQFENYILTPRVMKRALSIPALVTIIAALIGASLLGLIGGILAVPIAAAVLLILDEVVYPKADKN